MMQHAIKEEEEEQDIKLDSVGKGRQSIILEPLKLMKVFKIEPASRKR